MQNKSIKKLSSKKRSYRLLKKKLKIIFINKSLYGFLTTLASFRNLVNVILEDCKFNFLPKELEICYHLRKIILSRNYLINTTQSTWEWFNQSSIINNLELLKIKNNNVSFAPSTCSEIFRLANNRIKFLFK